MISTVSSWHCLAIVVTCLEHHSGMQFKDSQKGQTAQPVHFYRECLKNIKIAQGHQQLLESCILTAYDIMDLYCRLHINYKIHLTWYSLFMYSDVLFVS